MKKPITQKQPKLNPLIKLIIILTALYLVVGVGLFARVGIISFGQFSDIMLKYLSGLLFPFSVPFNSVMFHYQRLYDPNTYHAPAWKVSIAIFSASIGISLMVTIFGSIFSKNNTLRDISISLGIPLAFIWIIGSILYFILKYGRM